MGKILLNSDKELLLKDLCARLPYEVKIQYEDNIFTIDYISAMYEEIKLNTSNRYTIDVLEVKPYLFPLSSMTEEQKIECFKGTDIELDEHNEIWSTFPISNSDIVLTNLDNWLKVINWLNKNNFDYRGLIEKGLAINATGLNIY